VSKFQSFSRHVSQASCNRQTHKQTDYCNPPAHERRGLITEASNGNHQEEKFSQPH